PDGTVILSSANGLPTGFKPTLGAVRFPVYCNQIRVIAAGPPTTSSMAALEIEADGSIQCFGMAQAATRLDEGCRFPRDELDMVEAMRDNGDMSEPAPGPARARQAAAQQAARETIKLAFMVGGLALVAVVERLASRPDAA